MISPVLLITESPELGQQVTEILEDYPVVCCTGAEAAQFCRLQPFRVALVSEDLDKMSGIDLFENLKGIRPGLVGLLIAAENDPAVPCVAAMESGFTGLFCRPLDPGQLQSRVNKIMEFAELGEENARLRALLPLYGLGEKFLSSTTEEEVLESLLDVVVDQTAADSLSVMLFDEQEGCLKIAASRGIEEELARTIRIQPGDKIAGWVFKERKPVILNRDTQEDSPFASLLKRPEIVSAVSFPMIVRDRILGVLNVSHTDGDTQFADSSIEMLGILCTQASLALDNVHSIASMEQKTRVQTLLEQYVAPEVAQLMLAGDADMATGLGEIKRVTVLFADIRNFTGMVQSLPLDMLRDFLNDFFQVFTETIFQHRGMVDKFMGDAVLAVFGAPIELEHANASAVDTACAICRRFAELKERWQKRDQFFSSIDLGIAITCGNIFLGNVGSARRLDYTVIGTDVNIAQRLAAKSSGCRIYISEAVRRELDDDHLVWEDLGELELKGVHQPVRAFCTPGTCQG